MGHQDYEEVGHQASPRGSEGLSRLGLPLYFPRLPRGPRQGSGNGQHHLGQWQLCHRGFWPCQGSGSAGLGR